MALDSRTNERLKAKATPTIVAPLEYTMKYMTQCFW